MPRRSSTKLAESDVPLLTTTVGDRHAGATDVHRRGTNDEIGARQRHRDPLRPGRLDLA